MIMIPVSKIHCQSCKQDRADLSLERLKVRKYKIKKDDTSRVYPFWEASRTFVDEHIEDIVLCSQCRYGICDSKETLKRTSEDYTDDTITGYIHIETIEENYLNSIDLTKYIAN